MHDLQDYDLAGRLKTITHGSIAGYTYDYDRANRITAIDSLLDGASAFNYDLTDQLIGADHSNQTDEAYEFDLNGIPLAPASRLVDDLDLDSIDAINMAVRLEQETGLSLKEEELRSVQTIQDVVDVVHRKLQAAAGTDPS